MGRCLAIIIEGTYNKMSGTQWGGATTGIILNCVAFSCSGLRLDKNRMVSLVMRQYRGPGPVM